MSTLETRIAAKDRGQGLAGTGVVAIWNGIRDDLREDFMEWHPREHMVERLSIPGFLRGRRCIAIDGATEFLTLYELRNPEVLLTDVYRQRLSNPTDWSASTLPGFTDNTRGACRILFTEGYAMGAFVLTVSCTQESVTSTTRPAPKRAPLPPAEGARTRAAGRAQPQRVGMALAARCARPGRALHSGR